MFCFLLFSPKLFSQTILTVSSEEYITRLGRGTKTVPPVGQGMARVCLNYTPTACHNTPPLHTLPLFLSSIFTHAMHTHAFPNRLYAGCVRVSIVPLLVVVVPVLVAAVFGQLLLFLCHPYLNPLDKRRRQEECVGSGYNKKKTLLQWGRGRDWFITKDIVPGQ